MRKAEKEQIGNILGLLEQAHEAVRKNLEKQNIQPVLELLADCQEAVVLIGNRIRKSENAEVAVISILEAYAEDMCALFEKLIAVLSLQNADSDRSIAPMEMIDFSENLIDLNALLSQIKKKSQKTYK